MAENARLDEILTESCILASAPNPNRRITVRLNVNGVCRREETTEKPGATKYYIRRSGQFIYGKQNLFKGAFGIIPPELDGYESSSDLPAFDVNLEKCYPEWLFYYLKADNYYTKLSSLARGAGSKRIAPKEFLKIYIPCPPKHVQKKRLDSIRLQESIITELGNNLDTQVMCLANLRQQILQEAIEGKLTAEWRNDNHHLIEGDKQGAYVLEQIRAEKNGRISKPKQNHQAAPLPVTPTETYRELPTEWAWSRLGEVCSRITDGFHNTPPKVQSGIPYISATHVKSDGIDWENCDYVSEQYHKELWNKTRPQKGEILVVNIGAGSGTPALIDIAHEFSFKNTAILKFNQSLILSQYLFSFLLAVRERNYLEITRGGLQPFLSLTVLRNIPIPVPPVAEQHAIVERLSAIKLTTNDLETKILGNKAKTEALMQSVLREAFEAPVEAK